MYAIRSYYDALFDKHGRDMAQANYTSETQRISGLLTDLQLSENAAAIATLNLGQVVDRLFLVNSEFASRFMERNANEAAMPMVDVRAIRHEADAAIHFLFKAIEFCASEYENLDYTPLISQINELVAYYKAQIKARQSRRQSGANVSTEPPIATV